MQLKPETIDDIVLLVQSQFRTFGGGQITSANNPIAHAMKDMPAAFAAGVDVREVVDFVLATAKKLPKRKAVAK